MRLAARGRIFLARHRWVYWATLAGLAATVGVVVNQRLADLDMARTKWGTTQTVYVARRQHRPNDLLTVDAVDLPLAAVPPGALTEPPEEGHARQRIGRGEVVVTDDVVAATGLARRADPGTVVVGVVDALSPSPPIGARVHIASEGLVLARDAVVVEATADVVSVAVTSDDGATVAHAAQMGTASLMFIP